MEQLKTHLRNAWNKLSRLQVSGDAVDIVAGIRADLRRAYSATENMENKEENGNAEGNDAAVWERETKIAAAEV